MKSCVCSILNAREEKLLDGEGQLIVRLICNSCGRVLDSEIVVTDEGAGANTRSTSGGNEKILEAS